jgi:hypothetical protein
MALPLNTISWPETLIVFISKFPRQSPATREPARQILEMYLAIQKKVARPRDIKVYRAGGIHPHEPNHTLNVEWLRAQRLEKDRIPPASLVSLLSISLLNKVAHTWFPGDHSWQQFVFNFRTLRTLG